MEVTDRNGNPADPSDCNYYTGETLIDGVIFHWRNCRTHGHGEVIIQVVVIDAQPTWEFDLTP